MYELRNLDWPPGCSAGCTSIVNIYMVNIARRMVFVSSATENSRNACGIEAWMNSSNRIVVGIYIKPDAVHDRSAD